METPLGVYIPVVRDGFLEARVLNAGVCKKRSTHSSGKGDEEQ